jgi:hypothetical protein
VPAGVAPQPVFFKSPQVHPASLGRKHGRVKVKSLPGRQADSLHWTPHISLVGGAISAFNVRNLIIQKCRILTGALKIQK